MNKITVIILAAMLLFPPPTEAGKQERREAVIVLIENGGTVADKDAAMTTIKHLLGQLTTLKRRRATRNAQIMIVLSALPNRITWSGTPEQLLHQAQDVLDLIAFKPTYSDLILSFEQIDTTLRLSLPDSYRLYWIGPAIHVPFGNDNGEIQIKVPQAVPKDLKLAEIARGASTVRLYNVHPDQDEVYLDYFTDSGVMLGAEEGVLDLSLMDPAQTKAHLDDLL